ncbi:MAG: glycine--tRNA ligase subunit beta, partial [Anaerolineae bacterium]
IVEQAKAAAAQVDGTIVDDPALLDEVTNLVEQPTAVLGSFAEDYLELPGPVLMTVMRKHQRYFAVVDEEGDLLNAFVTIRNGGKQHLDTVAAGNEHVVRARFADARFFFNEDISQPLEAYLDSLDTLTFQEQLGSYREKAARVEGLTARIGAALGFNDETLDIAIRAAHLAKADLTTQMVVEMTSLQGIMGREYALRSGERPPVADAIADHYKPTSAYDTLPQTEAGIAIALADRIDSLVGLFDVGMQPTGTSDPYGLRRAALGIVQLLLGHALTLDLSNLAGWAAQGYTQELGSTFISEEHTTAAVDFIVDRLRGVLREDFPHDVVEAVVAEQGHNPYRAQVNAEQLHGWTTRDEWTDTLDQFARCVRITRNVDEDYTVDPGGMPEVVEKELLVGIEQLENKLGRDSDVDTFLTAFQPLIPAVQAFFAPQDEGGVLVMADAPDVRANRLGLLQRIVRAADGVADFSYMEGF